MEAEHNLHRTKQSKNSLSHKRNQGSQRIIKQIKAHQKATGFKVMVSMEHTWERGKSYSWKSSNWGSTKPTQVSTGRPEGPDSSDDDVPNSQNWGVRAAAVPAVLEDKKKMRVTCIRCMKGSKHPEEVWLKCGYTGCSRLNMHAKCNFINVTNMDKGSVKLFCRNYIRCQFHTGKGPDNPVAVPIADFQSSEAVESDEVFAVKKKAKHSKSKPRKNIVSPIISDSDEVQNTSYISKPPKKKAKLSDSDPKQIKLPQKHTNLPSHQKQSKAPPLKKQSQPPSQQKQTQSPTLPKLNKTPLVIPGSKMSSTALKKVSSNVKDKVAVQVFDKTLSKQKLKNSPPKIPETTSKISTYRYQDPTSYKSVKESSDEISDMDFSSKTKVFMTKKLSPEPCSQSSGHSLSYE